MVKLPQQRKEDITLDKRPSEDVQINPGDLEDFWSPQERMFFEDIRSIEHANLKIQEKKYYATLATTLFHFTNYYDRGESIKFLLWTKTEL